MAIIELNGISRSYLLGDSELQVLKGIDMDNESAVQGMHWVKKAIDSKIGLTQRAGDKEMTAAYTGLKNDLLSGMDAISPLNCLGETLRLMPLLSRSGIGIFQLRSRAMAQLSFPRGNFSF